MQVTKIVPTKTIPTNFVKNKVTHEIENFHILLIFV